MPNVKISDLPAGSAVTGAELVEAVQSGASVKLPLSGFTPARPFSFTSGLYYPICIGGGAGTQTPTYQRAHAAPFIVDATTTFDRIAVEITTDAAASVVRLGIYSDSGRSPGTRILDAGTVDSSTTGAKEITISQALDPGLYWLVAVPQAASGIDWRSKGPLFNMLPIGETAVGATGNSCFYVNGVTGALAATYTWVASSIDVPKLYLRAA